VAEEAVKKVEHSHDVRRNTHAIAPIAKT
jgi:hypothetical protein